MIKYKLLICDDNKDIHNDFKKILSKEETSKQLEGLENQLFDSPMKDDETADDDISFAIDSVFQGEDAIKEVEKAYQKNEPYALMFMDVRMPPGLDGIESSRRILEKFPQTQIVICTAFSDYSDDEIITLLGHSPNVMLIRKPFHPVMMKQIAASLVEKWKTQQKV